MRRWVQGFFLVDIKRLLEARQHFNAEDTADILHAVRCFVLLVGQVAAINRGLDRRAT